VPEPSVATLAIATALAAFVTGFLRGSVGGGIGLALTPVLSLVLPAQSALGLTGFMLNLADPIILRYYWRQWDARQLRLILPTALAGILIGVWLIAGMPDNRLRKVIGAVALVLALLQLLFMRARMPVAHHWGVGSGVGALTGIASAVANSGGVIMGPYLAVLGLSNAAVVATGAGALFTSNCLKVVSYWSIGFLTWRLVWLSLLASPLLYLGSRLGWRLNAYLPRRWFALALIAISLAGSIKLLLG
jgi:uncharacterized membrane protein YfcA